MIARFLCYIFLITLTTFSHAFSGSGCSAYFYDLCWQNRCDEYISVDLTSNSSYPYDSFWNDQTNSYECPSSGCKLCGINALGEPADDCFSPFPILSQIPNGKFSLSTTTTLLYSTFGFTKSCGTKNFTEMPVLSDALDLLGITPPKEDGFNDRTKREFKFDKSNNPLGKGSEYIYAKASQVGPGGYYLLQPRIKIYGTDKVIQFFISQWGWHTQAFSNLDGTRTENYFPLDDNSFSTKGFSFQWLRWRRMIICDDYNDRNKNDGRKDWTYTADYNTGDDRYCYIKVMTWNKLYDVVKNGYANCDEGRLSGLQDITSFKDAPSDSFRGISDVCRVNVDENNARDILSSGIIIPNKSGQYNFLNQMTKFQGGNYSIVSEPSFSISKSSDSTFLTPEVNLTISGGNPNAENSSENFTMGLGTESYNYQDGFFKYQLLLNVENNNSVGSEPELCLYGCLLDSGSECADSDELLEDLILNESDNDLVEYNKSEYLVDDCIPHKTIEIVDSVQDYNIAITDLGIDSNYIDPKMKVTISNSLDSSEEISQIFYLRSYEDNNGDQTVSYTNISEYSDPGNAPSYQVSIGDPYDYPKYDFLNTNNAMSNNIDMTIYTYLKNNNNQNIVMPFLFNNAVIYDESYLLYDVSDGKTKILNQPCSEFLRSDAGCYFDSASHATECGNPTSSDMCSEDSKYYGFICLHNLYNEYFHFDGSSAEFYSDAIKDSMYSYNNDLITNDYLTYINSTEYNNLDPLFPSAAQNLCIPKFFPLDTDKVNFNYELNTTGINIADINIKISRTDGNVRMFNAVDVPDPDYSTSFDYANFDISSLSQSDINSYCNLAANSNSTDIRYDYYHKLNFKIYNNSGFIYVCYKLYDAPDSWSLPSDWEMMMAYTMDYYSGNMIYSDFINLNICPDYSGTDIADFLSCPVQAAAHYTPEGEEIWCGCSSESEWNSFSTSEKNAAWSRLETNTVQLKGRCMMDGSWKMTDSNAFCPVFCDEDELPTTAIGAVMPKTLAIEDIKSSAMSVICVGGKNLYGGTSTYKCSGIDGEEGTWVDHAGSGICKTNCPTKYYDNNNNEVSSSSSYHFKLNAPGVQNADYNETVNCEYGYSGTATATCDYETNQWTNITNSCSASKLSCPSGWHRSSQNFSAYFLQRMDAGSGAPNCNGGYVNYNSYLNKSVEVKLSAGNYGTTESVSCNSSTKVKIDGAVGSRGWMHNNSITASCNISGSGASATARWHIDSSACKAKCYDLNSNNWWNPGSYNSDINNRRECCRNCGCCGTTRRRTRYCQGTCSTSTSSSGKWLNVGEGSGGCG